MTTDLSFSFPTLLLTQLPQLLAPHAITFSQDNPPQAPPEDAAIPHRRFTFITPTEDIPCRTITYPLYPDFVELVFDLPPVLGRGHFLDIIIALLLAHGAHSGNAEAFRCSCGYSLYGNTSGRCPECGNPIPSPPPPPFANPQNR